MNIFLKRLGIVIAWVVSIPVGFVAFIGLLVWLSNSPSATRAAENIAKYFFYPLMFLIIGSGIIHCMWLFIKWLFIEPFRKTRSESESENQVDST